MTWPEAVAAWADTARVLGVLGLVAFLGWLCFRRLM